MGGFIGCTAEFKHFLKMRSNTYIFGGPVPPPYLEAVCAVTGILASAEYELLQARLFGNVRRLVTGAKQLGLTVLSGLTPIVSVLVGDEAATLRAGHFLFDHGYYVQSVTFPAVPYHGGVLRVQVNSNHRPDAVDGLLEALAALQRTIHLPSPEEVSGKAA